ncbi:hypothetical protein [Limosilactobacillus pontis]|uniref:hypothetical protein n=1 Tax=Limosilactobacillus pontis TaxID=35787 RepID=UPI002F269BA6
MSEQIYHLTKRMERYSMHSALQQIGLFLLHYTDGRAAITRERLTDLGVIAVHKSTIRITGRQTLQQIIEREE